MADFSTQTRVNGYFYSMPERTYSLHSFKEQYRRNEPLVFSAPRAQSHDCRNPRTQEYTDPKFWEAMVFKYGLNNTVDGLSQLRFKEHESDPLKRPRDKLLYSVGQKGSGKEQFNFPRGLSTDSEGDILVADSKNHRIQRYNSGGIYKDEFGLKGEFRGEFLTPTDVAVLENDDLVVADSGNNRVQIFRPLGRLKHVFNTKAKPVYVVVDSEYNVYVSTVNRGIEIYDRGRQLVGEFPIEGDTENTSALPLAIAEKELIVGDIPENKVKIYSLEGELLHQFQPQTSQDGLCCQMSSVCVNPLGQIIISDSLNHTVNLYSDRGVFIGEILRPIDDLGSVQACTVGPEGHLNVTEFTVNGPHQLKIFRYGSCICHRSRAGSSKRTTPSTTG